MGPKAGKPAAGRRWRAPEGLILFEGEASATDFRGVPLPGVAEAHSYELRDGSGRVLSSYLPGQERLDEYKECFWLTRYQVIGDQLVKFTSHCFEESTYDTPFAQEKGMSVAIEGLSPHPARNEDDRC